MQLTRPASGTAQGQRLGLGLGTAQEQLEIVKELYSVEWLMLPEGRKKKGLVAKITDVQPRGGVQDTGQRILNK